MALLAIRSQSLRTMLTIFIIGFGIMALVGILTAIDVIKASITENFTTMGANTFNIRNRGSNIRIGRSSKKNQVYRVITYQEAVRFKQAFQYPATVGLSSVGSFATTIKFESRKSNPNITVFGGDDAYFITSGYELAEGRNFSALELENGIDAVIIGDEVQQNLFGNSSAIDKTISVGAVRARVIGVLKAKGASFGFGGDKMVVMPLKSVRRHFQRDDMSYVINVLAPSAEALNEAIGEATGLFRSIRKVPLRDDPNFEITKSDNLSVLLIDNLRYVTIAATLIALITLIGAAIGLMNIMLVSVTERTREIGVRKAIGARANSIRNQFLVEAIVICQLGGGLGILLGIGMGNLVSFYFSQGFIIPWAWMIVAAILCFIVGLLSGIIPAMKAARLDPIEALRFE
jgi:putative ABC transport system permease protein